MDWVMQRQSGGDMLRCVDERGGGADSLSWGCVVQAQGDLGVHGCRG